MRHLPWACLGNIEQGITHAKWDVTGAVWVRLTRLLKEKAGASAMVRFERALMLAKALGDRGQERRATRGLAAAARLQARTPPAEPCMRTHALMPYVPGAASTARNQGHHVQHRLQAITFT